MALKTDNSQVIWIKLAQLIERVFGNSAFLVTFFALLNTFGQAIFLNRIANRHHLFPKATYLPALGFLLITSFFNDWNYLSAGLISNWLLLGMLSSILQLYNLKDAGKQIFDIGCYISLTSLLVFPNISFLLLLLVALAILRPFKPAEWLIALLGTITPFYFLAAILFLTDQLVLIDRIIAVGVSLPSQINNPETELASFSAILILLVTGFYYLSHHMSRMLIQNKKWWWVIILFLFISIIAGVFTVARGYNQWLAFLVPSTFIYTNVWFEERKKWVNSLIFYLLVAVILFVQWYPVVR